MIQHGRSEFDATRHGTAGNPHFVPEGWEDLDRGICPGCGLTVSWCAEGVESPLAPEGWYHDETLTVLVLTEDEVRWLAEDPRIGTEHGIPGWERRVELMADLNRPYEDDSYTAEGRHGPSERAEAARG